METSSFYDKTYSLIYCSFVVCIMFSIQGLCQTVYAYISVGLLCGKGAFQACCMTLCLHKSVTSLAVSLKPAPCPFCCIFILSLGIVLVSFSTCYIIFVLVFRMGYWQIVIACVPSETSIFSDVPIELVWII